MTDTEKQMLVLLLRDYEDQRLAHAQAMTPGNWRQVEIRKQADAARLILSDIQ